MTLKFTLASTCWLPTVETKEINTIEDLIGIMKEYNEAIILYPEKHEREINKADYPNEHDYWEALDTDRFYYDFSDITLCVYDSYIE